MSPKNSGRKLKGHSVLEGHPEITECLKRLKSGTDEIVIGSCDTDETEVRTASMADVSKLVAGIKFLVKGWIPFAMITMVFSEPGIGKSAFVLYALIRSVVLGCDWFNGTKGPAKPGYVLSCDTEGAMAITMHRINDWGLPADKIKVPFEDDPLRPIDLSNPEHLKRMESVINRLPCMVAINSYWSEMYGDALADWRVIEYDTTTRGGGTRREFLWMNYAEPSELHTSAHSRGPDLTPSRAATT